MAVTQTANEAQNQSLSQVLRIHRKKDYIALHLLHYKRRDNGWP